MPNSKLLHRTSEIRQKSSVRRNAFFACQSCWGSDKTRPVQILRLFGTAIPMSYQVPSLGSPSRGLCFLVRRFSPYWSSFHPIAGKLAFKKCRGIRVIGPTLLLGCVPSPTDSGRQKPSAQMRFLLANTVREVIKPKSTNSRTYRNANSLVQSNPLIRFLPCGGFAFLGGHSPSK